MFHCPAYDPVVSFVNMVLNSNLRSSLLLLGILSSFVIAVGTDHSEARDATCEGLWYCHKAAEAFSNALAACSADYLLTVYIGCALLCYQTLPKMQTLSLLATLFGNQPAICLILPCLSYL